MITIIVIFITAVAAAVFKTRKSRQMLSNKKSTRTHRDDKSSRVIDTCCSTDNHRKPDRTASPNPSIPLLPRPRFPKKPTLVLDLDETLVHASDLKPTHPSVPIEVNGRRIWLAADILMFCNSYKGITIFNLSKLRTSLYRL